MSERDLVAEKRAMDERGHGAAVALRTGINLTGRSVEWIDAKTGAVVSDAVAADCLSMAQLEAMRKASFQPRLMTDGGCGLLVGLDWVWYESCFVAYLAALHLPKPASAAEELAALRTLRDMLDEFVRPEVIRSGEGWNKVVAALEAAKQRAAGGGA